MLIVQITPQKVEIAKLGYKTRANFMLTRRTHFKYKGMNRLKVKVWEKIYHTDTRKKPVVAIFMLRQIDFVVRYTTRNKKGNFIVIKESIS